MVFLMWPGFVLVPSERQVAKSKKKDKLSSTSNPFTLLPQGSALVPLLLFSLCTSQLSYFICGHGLVNIFMQMTLNLHLPISENATHIFVDLQGGGGVSLTG